MSDDDPFEQFEDVEDREGDPFEQFEDVGDREADGTPDGDPDEASDTGEDSTDPLGDGTDGPMGYDGHDITPAGHRDELPDETGEETADTGDEGVVEMDEPEIDTGTEGFGDAGARSGDPFEQFDDVFEEMSVGDVDPDEVWDSLADAQERGSVSEADERRYAEVSKHRYCEQCEFFSEPPDVSCSHDSTEILEFLDQETVRLVDCPVVAEREELEKHE